MGAVGTAKENIDYMFQPCQLQCLTFTRAAFLMIELYLQYNLTIVMKADKRTYQIVTRVWEEGHTIG